MNNFDRVLVPISWKNEGKEVILKGNFPDFPTVKMQDVYSLNSKSEKSTLLWLPTGKYYYSFLVDGKEQIDLSKPTEIIKDPMILEFLGLERKTSYYEKDLESAIISHIADFLLEMGKGFSFVSRQQRILLEDDEYFVDLVFYNRLLRCFVLIELKIGKLTHQDLGQLQMYVNYYDRKIKLDEENPTIGILLCSSKNDTAVKMALPENNNTILASEYQLYLPTSEELVKEINEVKQLAQEIEEEK